MGKTNDSFGTDKKRYFVHSLAKGLSVLQAFPPAGRPLTLTEIARHLKVNKTTVTRLCYTLTELGFLIRDRHRLFHLTPKVLTLGHALVSGLGWREAAESFLQGLFEEVQETVNLAILDDSEILYVIRLKRDKFLPIDIRMGSKLPVYCTGPGKVLMAMGPPEKTKPILAKLEFRPLTPRTIISLAQFKKELESVRKKGYAISDEEFAEGNRAIAAPILDKNGIAVAAINFAVPTKRYSRADLVDRLLEPLLQTAKDISIAWQHLDTPVSVVDYY